MAEHERESISQEDELQANSLEVSLTVQDLSASVDWYRTVLGFVVDREHRRDTRLFAVSLRAGKVRILLAQDDGSRGLNRQKGEGFSFQITTAQNIDAWAERVRKSGVVLETDVVEISPGKRVFRLRDPDGFRIAISSDPAARQAMSD